MAPDHLKLGQRMAMLMMMMMMGYLSAPNPFTHLGTKWVWEWPKNEPEMAKVERESMATIKRETRNAKFPSAARKLFYDAFKLIFWKNNVKTDFLFAVAAAVGENCWLRTRGHVKILFYLPSLRAHFEVERVAVASCEFRIRNSELEMQVTGESWPSFCALPIVCSHELVIKLAQRPSSHLLASRRTANGNLLLLSQLHRRHFPFCPVSRGHQSKLRHKIFSLSRTFVK